MQIPALILLNPADSVAVATRDIAPGSPFTVGLFTGIAADVIPSGHKLAVMPIPSGAPVLKYGQVIGNATQPIAPGAHVHVHNLIMGDMRLEEAIGSTYRPTVPTEGAQFQGIVRASGKVGTRNYIGIIASVNCSATVCRYIAEAFKGNALADYPNVDGIVAITHSSGCGMSGTGEGIELLQRTLRGYADHPNFAGVLLIGLGCEVNQIAPLAESLAPRPAGLVASLTIQAEGGTRETVDHGIAFIKTMLPLANAVSRTPVSARHLIVGLQCGGSDGYSGITANPALGAAVDLLVRQGGTAILSETPEIYGAEHLLTARAVSPEVAEKLLARIRWWEKYTHQHKSGMNNNPSPGNKAGGITTILEKSLGAVAKAGTSGLMAVVDYADPVTAAGLVFMDTPGYDPVSATGQVAGGATLICFTTGRGSTYGCKPTPSLKLATTSALFKRMAMDMDFNSGTILDGGQSVAEAGATLFQLMLDTASGTPTRSEEHGMGDNEFVPWHLGAVM
jgi:altronate hydrolase